MARRRYVAPPRERTDPGRFTHPAFAGFAAHHDLLLGRDWPVLARLDARLGAAPHPHSGRPLRFVAQTPALLADGRHYETRILETGAIATREANWHDLLNALVWLEQRGLKAALNLRQADDVARGAVAERTRAQCAATLFDEAGVVVVLRDPNLVEAWDAHDWARLLWTQRAAWLDGSAEVIVFGHALLERLLDPYGELTAKALVVHAQRDEPALATLAAGIARGELLRDPQELRPLPVSGLPGWHAGATCAQFFTEAACFRPLPPGRRYPAPLPGSV